MADSQRCDTVKKATTLAISDSQTVKTSKKETSAMKKECNTVSFKGQVIYAGIDIHKKSWQVSVRHCRLQVENFSMDPSAAELANHLKKKYPEAEYRSVYEAGFSGFEAHRTLCKLGVKNIVINPADVPTSGKEREYKNDSADSRKLARELENGSLEGIYIPEPANLELRNLVRRETKLTGNITRIKNRIHSHLFFIGLKFTSWAGRSLKIMKSDAEKRHDDALLSELRELRFLREEKLLVIRDEHEGLKRLKREKIQENLQSIPGIGFRTAIVLQAELWELSRFPNKDSLNSYVGLAPHTVGSGEHEEIKLGGNRKKKQLHYILIEASWRAVRFNLEYRARYGRLIAKGACPQRAISIIAKKLLLSIRAIWLQNRNFVELLPRMK